MEKVNETKENIVHQAIHLIKAKGYDNVTINDICRASGISKHTFYYYFESKEDVLMRFFSIPHELPMQRISAMITMTSPIQQLWYLIEPRVAHFLNLGPEIVQRVIIINLQKDIGTFRYHEGAKTLQQLEYELLKKAQESGEIQSQSSPEDLSQALRVQFVGLTSLWAMHTGNLDLLPAFKRQFRILLGIPEHIVLPDSIDPATCNFDHIK